MLIENIAKIFHLVHMMNKENAIIAKKCSSNACNTVKELET